MQITELSHAVRPCRESRPRDIDHQQWALEPWEGTRATTPA